MFDVLPKLLSSVASFLFPLFASYKALKTSDPAQLAPWLMYWSVLSCALLVESWTEFILVWVPFYSYLRLFFLLYLVLPQTQGARYLYETYLFPYLADNETQIEEFIASAHDRLKAAGIAYLKQAIEVLRTKVLGLPPSEIAREDQTPAAARPQSYTQGLLARFSMPAARWASDGASNAGQEFFNLLAGAVGAAAGAASGPGATTASPVKRMVPGDLSASGTLIPDSIGGTQEKMSFIAAQKERLAFILSALDKEAKDLEKTEEGKKDARPPSMSLDGESRPPSGQSMWSALSKSRSEVDFEKIDAESGAEDNDSTGMRRRPQPSEMAKGWNFLGWGSVAGAGGEPETAASSGMEK